MKTIYRGHEINVNRERSMGGWHMMAATHFDLGACNVK